MLSSTVLNLASKVIPVFPRRSLVSGSNRKINSKYNYTDNKSRNVYTNNINYNNSHNNNKPIMSDLPVYVSGNIVRGFGRGSKELGIPTANLELQAVKSLPSSLQTGVYYGWANVNNKDVHKMVLSIGWNPYYGNKEKSVETHILHDFNCDLYGQLLKICIVGYLRPEQNFDSLDDLINTIKSDIEKARILLDTVENKKLQEAIFFKNNQDEC